MKNIIDALTSSYSLEGEFEVGCLFDSDGVASVELICDSTGS